MPPSRHQTYFPQNLLFRNLLPVIGSYPASPSFSTFFLPTSSICCEISIPSTLIGIKQFTSHNCHIAGSGCNIKNNLRIIFFQPPDGFFSPADIGSGGKKTVHKIIAARNPVKHFGHLLFLAFCRIFKRNNMIVR